MPEYTFGADELPEWVGRKISAYMAMDGSTGYEIHFERMRKADMRLRVGDKLKLSGFDINVEREQKA